MSYWKSGYISEEDYAFVQNLKDEFLNAIINEDVVSINQASVSI